MLVIDLDVKILCLSILGSELFDIKSEYHHIHNILLGHVQLYFMKRLYLSISYHNLIALPIKIAAIVRICYRYVSFVVTYFFFLAVFFFVFAITLLFLTIA